VSTYAGQLEPVARARGETILERRVTRQIIAVVGVLAGIGGSAFAAHHALLQNQSGQTQLVSATVWGRGWGDITRTGRSDSPYAPTAYRSLLARDSRVD
jgi:hypothetical protein